MQRQRVADLAHDAIKAGNAVPRVRRILIFVVFALGVGVSGLHIYFNLFGLYDTFFLRPMHLLLLGALGFILYDHRGRRRKFDRFSGWLALDLCLMAAFCYAAGRIVLDQEDFLERYVSGLASTADIYSGGVLLVLVMELVRRVVGYPILFVALAFIGYALLGHELPGILKHRPFSIFSFIEFQYMDFNGLWNLMGIIGTTVIMFIVYGSFFEKARGGILIQHIGNYLFGTSAGGPAKVSVVTSSLFGTLSGSAVANVVGTGSFTIPTMKRTGLPGHMAGAVEAVASSGGQIMPPVMGAAAFVMADFLGVSYLSVVAAALLPAIMYYAALFVVMHFEARRRGIGGLSREELPGREDVMRYLHLALPLFVLIGMLVAGYSPVRSAMVATLATVAMAFLRPATRMHSWDVLRALFAAAETTLVVTISCAAAGIVIGVLDQTGFGLRLSSLIINTTEGHLMATLILVMATCLVLGMGMPTVPAYVITVAIAGPILIDMGVNAIAAHMFVLYFAVLSLITPPVMIASYAAASLAETSVMRLGTTALRLALIAFIMPFFFVYNPELLLGAVPMNVARLGWVALTAFLGAITFAAATAGYYFGPIGWAGRILLFGIGLMLINPGHQTDGMAALILLAVTLSRPDSRVGVLRLIRQALSGMKRTASRPSE